MRVSIAVFRAKANDSLETAATGRGIRSKPRKSWALESGAATQVD
jgi:hypothetical protein